jgi:hypothetical protein
MHNNRRIVGSVVLCGFAQRQSRENLRFAVGIFETEPLKVVPDRRSWLRHER